MNGRWAIRLLASAVSLAASLVYAEGGCFVTCLSNRCELSRANSADMGHAAACQPAPAKLEGRCSLKEGEVVLMPRCRRLVVHEGNVMAHLRSQGHAARVPAGSSAKLETLLAKYPRLDCFSGEKSCATRSSVAVSTGRAFDPASPWEPVGDPCGMGLPCGTVRLPAGSWRFRTLELSSQGQLRISSTRGQAREYVAAVNSGVVQVPGGWLQPAQSYRYRLVSADGQVIAAGEFLTPSTKAQKSIDASLAEAGRQPPTQRKAAVLESLLADGLEWDALQLTLGEGVQR